jgi:hypothetical protein
MDTPQTTPSQTKEQLIYSAILLSLSFGPICVLKKKKCSKVRRREAPARRGLLTANHTTNQLIRIPPATANQNTGNLTRVTTQVREGAARQSKSAPRRRCATGGCYDKADAEWIAIRRSMRRHNDIRPSGGQPLTGLSAAREVGHPQGVFGVFS